MPRMHPMAPSRRRHPLLSTLTLGLAFAATALVLAAPQPTATAAAPSPAHGGKKARKCPASSCGLATTAQLDALVQKMEDSLYSAANGIYDASEPVAAAYQTTLSADGKGCSTERVAATGGAAFPDPSCEARAADAVPSVVVKARCPSSGQYAIQDICAGAVVDAGGKVLSLVPMVAAGASLAEATCGVAAAAVPIPAGARLVVQQTIVCAFDSSAAALAALIANSTTTTTKTTAAAAAPFSSKKPCRPDAADANAAAAANCGLATAAELEQLAEGWRLALAAASEALRGYDAPMWASFTTTADGKTDSCKVALVDTRPPPPAYLGYETWCGGGVVGEDGDLSMQASCPPYTYFLIFDSLCEGRVLDAEGKVVSLLPLMSKGGARRTTMCTVDITDVVVPPGGRLELRHDVLCGGGVSSFLPALGGSGGGGSGAAAAPRSAAAAAAREALAAVAAEASGGRISTTSNSTSTSTSTSTDASTRRRHKSNKCPADLAAKACGLVSRARLDQAAKDAALALNAVLGALHDYLLASRASVKTVPDAGSAAGCRAGVSAADPPDLFVGAKCAAHPDRPIPSLVTLAKCPDNYRLMIAESCYGSTVSSGGGLGTQVGLLAEGAAARTSLCSVRTDTPIPEGGSLEMVSNIACGFNTAALIEASEGGAGSSNAPAVAKKALAALAAKARAAVGAGGGGESPVDAAAAAWREKGLF